MAMADTTLSFFFSVFHHNAQMALQNNCINVQVFWRFCDGINSCIVDGGFIILRTDVTVGDGEVEILVTLECPCEFYCVITDSSTRQFLCYCPADQALAEDGITCLGKSIYLGVYSQGQYIIMTLNLSCLAFTRPRSLS